MYIYIYTSITNPYIHTHLIKSYWSYSYKPQETYLLGPRYLPMLAFYLHYFSMMVGRNNQWDISMDGWMDGWMDAWMDGWMDGSVVPELWLISMLLGAWQDSLKEASQVRAFFSEEKAGRWRGFSLESPAKPPEKNSRHSLQPIEDIPSGDQARKGKFLGLVHLIMTSPDPKLWLFTFQGSGILFSWSFSNNIWMMDLGMCGRYQYVVDMSWICHWIQRIWGKNRCAFRRSSKHKIGRASCRERV